MALFQYVQNDARDYFHIGRVNPGDIYECDEAPDWCWELVDPSSSTATPATSTDGAEAPETAELPTDTEEA